MTNTLISKIAAASTKVGALATDKTNTQQNYKYISADKVLERGGDALAAAGVVIIPSITAEAMERVDTGNGKSRFDSVVTFAMHVTDGETDLQMPWVGRGSDYTVPDKALYKAITSGHKYFLMKLLNIGVGNEDGEHENAPQAAQDAPTPKQKAADVSFDKPKPQLATKAQLKQLGDLGVEFYKGEWAEQLPKLVLAVTKGATSDVSQLQPAECAKLIAGIQHKMAEAVPA